MITTAPFEAAMLAAAAETNVSRRELLERARRLRTENEDLREKLAEMERQRDEARRQRDAALDSCRLLGDRGLVE